MARLGMWLALAAASLTQAPSIPGIVTHEAGYDARVVAEEWARDFAKFDTGGPQADRVGNIYLFAPTDDHGPTQILKLTKGASTVFAEVEGPGDPYLVGMGFDPRNELVVIVHTTHLFRDGGYGIHRSFHKITGFPSGTQRPAVTMQGGILDQLTLYLPPQAVLLSLALTVCVAGAVVGRQVLRELRGIFGG